MNLRTTETLLLALALVMATASGLQAQAAEPDGAPEGALFLLLPVGAEGVSMGRAMTWIESPEASFWNPAGLAGIQRSQALVFRGDHPVGDATAVSALFARPGLGTMGASYFLQDVGEIDQTDEFGNYTGRITIRNHLGIVSGATRLASRLDLGLSLKLVRFQFSCRGICANEGTTATTWAVDAGVQGRPMERLRVGAMVAHLGPDLQVLNAEQSDPLPARIRVAAAYNVVAAITDTEELQGWLAFEVQDRLKALGSLSYYLGAELTAGQIDALSVRSGYVWSDLPSEDGGRVGLGLRYERFDLAIAKSLAVSPLPDETDAVHVTFSIGF
ncbi:MAG: hypothetical protein R3253_05780 [Longimicrobiales bacterium]|nr:hypothetical protein [Longimicrobiales bacterium]